MNYSTYYISLDIHDTSSQVSLNIKRGDTARRICAVLTENGKPYKIDNGVRAVFRAKKPVDVNGYRHIVYNDASIESNQIIHNITSATSEIAGIADCEFTLYGADGKIITSPKFTLVIDSTVNTDNEVEEEGRNELTALSKAMTDVARAIDNTNEAAVAAKSATENAQTATNAANDATVNAQTATEKAESATVNANNAASFAETAAHIAGVASKNANDAAKEAEKVVNRAENGEFNGKDGAVFIPSVSKDGIISWTNDGGLSNPQPTNIKGAPGDTPYIGRKQTWCIGDLDTGVAAVGRDGKTPYIGTDGRWYIGEVDTGVYARGIDGNSPYIGADGNWITHGNYNTGVPARGEDGTDGETPFIGENGNWWIGDTDTGTPAKSTEKEWELFHSSTFAESYTSCTVQPTKQYTEVFVQCELVIDTTATSAKSIDIIVGRSGVVVTRNSVTVSNGTKVYYRACGRLSPTKTLIYDAIAGVGAKTGVLASNCGDASTKQFDYLPDILIQTSAPATYMFGAGSIIKVWGR